MDLTDSLDLGIILAFWHAIFGNVPSCVEGCTIGPIPFVWRRIHFLHFGSTSSSAPRPTNESDLLFSFSPSQIFLFCAFTGSRSCINTTHLTPKDVHHTTMSRQPLRPPSPSFTGVPLDVHERIADYLSLRDYSSLSLTNNQLHATYEHRLYEVSNY